MSTVRGFFHPPDSLGAPGFVRGRVGILWARSLLDITFAVDTGSPYTLLLDHDFMAALTALGCPFRLPVFQWLRMRSDLFRPLSPATSLGGSTLTIFELKYSWLWLCQPNGRLPRDSALLAPIYATFSRSFATRRGAAPAGSGHVSLLGRCTLARIRGLKWDSRDRNMRLLGA